MHLEAVQKRVEAWRGKRVGVLGDLMLDRYVWGRASRISQEAPIPVVEVVETTLRPGGAANVLCNVQSLGAQAVALGVVGADEGGEALAGLLHGLGVETDALLRDDSRVTTEKMRVIAGNQQIVRVDTERKAPLLPDKAAALLKSVTSQMDEGGLDALIVEDYAKGTLGRDMMAAVMKIAQRHAVPVALDPHPANPMDLPGFKLMTPNRAEAFALAGIYLTPPVFPIGQDEALLRTVQRLQELYDVEHLLVTLGAGGMGLFRHKAPPLHVPTLAREVFDVSGAGDTVISSFTLALVAGATPEEAAVIANHAAGVVVGKVGTAPVHAEELLQSFAREDES